MFSFLKQKKPKNEIDDVSYSAEEKPDFVEDEKSSTQSEQEYLKELEAIVDLNKKLLREKLHLYEEDLKNSNQTKIEALKAKHQLIIKSGVLRVITQTLKETYHWCSWHKNPNTSWHLHESLGDVIFFPETGNVQSKEFDFFFQGETRTKSGKLQTSIGIVKSNIEIFLYQTDSFEEHQFGVVELFSNNQRKLEFDVSRSLDDEYDDWEWMENSWDNDTNINFCSDLDWIPDVLCVIDHLHHAEELSKKKNLSLQEEYLIKKNNL